ncbi:hypothetical protein VITU102760_19220 [Vibrio tubiashii]
MLTLENINMQRNCPVANAIKATSHMTLSDIAHEYNYIQVHGLSW